jgi:hypothetical protein
MLNLDSQLSMGSRLRGNDAALLTHKGAGAYLFARPPYSPNSSRAMISCCTSLAPS